jgi:hypothetical protein
VGTITFPPDSKKLSTWREEIKKVTQCAQRQDSTFDQLHDLAIIANKFGFYDAADYLKDLE